MRSWVGSSYEFTGANKLLFNHLARLNRSGPKPLKSILPPVRKKGKIPGGVDPEPYPFAESSGLPKSRMGEAISYALDEWDYG